MKTLIKLFVAVLILYSTYIGVQEYEVRKVLHDIKNLIAETPEFSRLSIRRAKPLMIELEGSFETPESLHRFTSAVDRIKAKRLFFKPSTIYPPQEELIKPPKI